MRESRIEAALKREGKKRGVWVLKAETLCPGFPDRLLLAPGGRFALAETKRPGGVLRTAQRVVRRWLRKLGFEVHVLDSLDAVKGFYETWLN